MNFIEPEESNILQTVPVSVVLNKLPISPENKEWLCGLLSENEIPGGILSDFEYFEELVKKSDEAGSNSFRALLLFDYYGILSILSDNINESKLSHERINIFPELFTQKQDDKPVVFQAYAASILDGIRNCAEKDKNFYEAYQKKLREIRADSSLAQRICYYIKAQNLPKRTYETGEKPATPDEISFILRNAEEKYSMRLVAELEEIHELDPDFYVNAVSLPFLLYGKESFTSIVNALFLMGLTQLPHKGNLSGLIEKIEIPQWDDKNYIHEIFFESARISNDKDFSVRILDKVFEGVNAVDIPYIFFEYIEGHNNSFYGPLLKEGYSDVIEPIQPELEYLDWALTTDTNAPHKIYFDKSRLFLDYLEKLSHSAPEDKLELFQELFFQRAASNHHFQTNKFWAFREKPNIKDILDLIVQKKIHGEVGTFPEQQKEANGLCEKFVDVIAEGAAKYPVKLFLSEGIWLNLQMQKQNDYGFAVFKRYCEKLELKNSEDALFITKFWFDIFYLEQQLFLSSFSTSQRYFSELEKEGPFFYKNVFHKFIDDENFICRFLSVPQNNSSGHSLSVYCLAYYVLYQYKDEKMSDVFKEASKKLLHGKKITFPDKIAEFIRSYKIPDKFLKNGYDNEAARFLFYLSAALGGEQYDSILKNLNGAEEHFPLYFIRYKYSHYEIVQEEFLNFLFSLKNPNRRGNKNEFYNLELIQEACESNVLKKQVVLEKVSDYIEKNRMSLFKSSGIERIISYFFIKTEEGKTYEAQTKFITQFCERAVQENGDSYTELYLFLRIRSFFCNNIDPILEIHADINDVLVTRCGKMLNNFRKNVEQKEFPEDEHTFLNDYILPASDFVWERTGNIWKALKPLILTFRASKDILLNEALHPANNVSYLFLNMITSFFMIEDQEKLKELRYDMANDFAEYLKPAKNERQAEKYAQIEREEEGFDLSCTEPSPYWRYAYIRALGDLGVKTDKRGHYFHKILENVSEKDPSKDVQSAAKKVMKKLDSIRKGYSGAKHKKCLFEAFWWLKNAHMLSLGGKVDDKKALELRIKEWRWR